MAGQLSPEVLTMVAGRFRVLAEPARLRILNVLLDGELTVSELVHATQLNQANVSKHLGLLRESGFVERRKEGVFSYYTIADDSVSQLCTIMCGRIEARLDEHATLLAMGA